jgi:hypothetical protein
VRIILTNDAPFLFLIEEISDFIHDLINTCFANSFLVPPKKNLELLKSAAPPLGLPRAAHSAASAEFSSGHF